MNRSRECRSNSGILWGGAFVLVGTVLLLERMGLIPSFEWHRLWPVFLIIPGIVQLLQPGRRASGGMLLALGILFELQMLGVAHVTWGEIWPVALIGIGLIMIWGTLERKNIPPAQVDPLTSFNETVVFSGLERRVTSRTFRGGRVMTVFGGAELDMREADIDGTEATIEVNCIFGGCEIRVPETWSVVSAGQGMFGGYSDKTHQRVADPASGAVNKTLVLRGAVVFGGVEIKN